jgi:hypothetical protein
VSGRPTLESEICVRLETLAMIEAALVFDGERVLEILRGSDYSLELRACDAITLACYVIWRTEDPAAVLAELRADAIDGDVDGERHTPGGTMT